jgi:NAD(P)-dependent dehydrogenase (short-subunit alcohol dehydrogenase family)
MTGKRHWLSRARFARPVDLRGRRAIITGTAPGSIGFETARLLAAWGADLSITSRSRPEQVASQLLASLEGAAHGNVDAHALDLSKAASVDAFADWHRSTHREQLDLLVNNAGIHLDLLSQWKAPKLSADGHELHWRTNFLGTLHLTQRLLPSLCASGRARGGARIINLVSHLHTRGSNEDMFGLRRPYDSWQAYGNSKLALMHASAELQRRHAAIDRVQAYSVHPGAVFTNIADGGLAGNPRLVRLRRRLASVERLFLLSPLEGAQTTLHCATHPDAVGGLYYHRCAPARASKHCADTEVSARLWQVASDWIKAQAAIS